MSDKSKVVLEELMAMALEQANQIKSKNSNDFDSGRLMAFYELLSVAKEQAGLMGVVFEDKNLNALNPEDLLKP